MNLANGLTVLFCLMSAGVTYWIIRMTWYTTIGTRRPIKNLDWRVHLLLLPLCVAFLGTWSIIMDPDWTNPIQLMPKVVALSVWITLGLSLVKWFRAPNPMDVTLESFMRRHWPKTQIVRADEYKNETENDPELAEMFEAGNVLRIPDTNLMALVFVYFDYLRSTGHEIQDPMHSVKSGQFGSLGFCSKNDGDTFHHIIIYCEKTSTATFSENVVQN